MNKSSQLTPENFENLLNWLETDREQAGILYEEIRQGLIRFFRFRGCNDEDVLADETFNRVAKKVLTFDAEKKAEPSVIIYGFAKNIFLEYRSRRLKEIEFKPDLNYHRSDYKSGFDFEENCLKCLDCCLKKLSETDNRLIIEYYSENKSAKIDLRKKLAEELELNAGTLHTKIYRIRINLKKCIQKCLDENNR